MAAFTFTDPSGKSYTVQGPDGATQDQAWAMLQQQLKAQPPAAPEPSTLDKIGQFGKGMAQSGGRMLMNAATGIPGIFADGTAAVANVGADALGAKRPFPTLPSQALQQGLEPALGKAPSLASPGGVAEAIGSGVATPANALENVAGSFLSRETQQGAAAASSGAAAPAQAATTRPQQVATLAKEGVRLDNSQSQGGKLALTLKNAANDGPYGDAQAFRAGQSGDFTAAALRQMGITDAREATPGVMAAGKARLKSVYNQVADRNGVELDGDLAEDIDRIRTDALGSLTPEHAKVITGRLDDILTMMERNTGDTQQLSGEAYQKIQSALGKIAKDGGKAPFVTDIRRSLTEAMQRQASPGDAQLLTLNNQRYAAMKAVEKSIGPDNQVSPSLLYNALDTAKGANQSVYGQGANTRLMDLAQAGKAVIGTNTANSGTSQRLAGMAAVGTAGAAVEALATGHFEVAGGLAAAAAIAGVSQKAAKELIYSPAGKAWLQRAAQARVMAGKAARGAGQLGQAGAVGAAEMGSGQSQDQSAAAQ